MNDTLIIMPAYNEEKNIRDVLAQIKSFNLPADVVVINDGSADSTREAAEAEGVTVITHPFNLGYGAALQTGFKYAVEKGYENIIQFDSDGQHDPAHLSVITGLLKEDAADFVIGSRFLGQTMMKIGILKKLAIVLFRMIIYRLTKVRVSDPTSGFKGMKRHVFAGFSSIYSFPSDFPDTNILVHVLKRGYKIKEFPTNIRERKEGKGMHSGLKPIFYMIKMMLSIFIVVLREKAERGV